ncbi:MAG: prenyltransferase/squalene oxidase repeat-containing protein [Planctomycetota bacterium]|jgi:hypothetical protein
MLQTQNNQLKAVIETIKANQLPQGGFAAKNKGSFRPDATAWAVIAMRACGVKDETLLIAQQRLKTSQQADGRIALSQDQPSVLWPTPLAILAWLNEPQFDQARNKAINFLLSTSGIQSSTPSFVEHNGMLKGWSWNEQTHSWVIPTAITVGMNKHIPGSSPQL